MSERPPSRSNVPPGKMPPLVRYERLVPITILGHPAEVPENNPLLRGFAHLCPEGVTGGRFCWKHECASSKFYYRLPGETEERKARACRFIVVPGMEITVLSAELKFALKKFLQRFA